MSGNFDIPPIVKRLFGLLLFFSPEVVLLIIWILFRSSLIDVRNVMMADSIEVASTRLVAISAISLMIIQWLRIYPFPPSNIATYRGVHINLTSILVMLFIALGIASQLPSIHNMMNTSYLGVVMSFITMAGSIYLFTELLVIFISRVVSTFRGK